LVFFVVLGDRQGDVDALRVAFDADKVDIFLEKGKFWVFEIFMGFPWRLTLVVDLMIDVRLSVKLSYMLVRK